MSIGSSAGNLEAYINFDAGLRLKSERNLILMGYQSFLPVLHSALEH